MSHRLLKIFIVMGCTALLLDSGGCRKDIIGPETIAGSGHLVSQSRDVGTFTGVRVTGIGKVIITQDAQQSVRIEADDNVIGRIETSVHGGVLDVGLTGGSYSNVTINISISMSTIDRLESVGTADFTTPEPISAGTITCNITGAGKIRLKGTATKEIIVLAGAGDVQNFDLVAAQGVVTISGTGNVEVNASDQLDAVVSGVGTITYAGNPPIVHSTISGVGAIKPKP